MLSISSAFVHTSSFTVGGCVPLRSCKLSCDGRRPTRHNHNAPVRMIAPKHVRRSEEIKRLTKQLEELKAARERLAKSGQQSTTSIENHATPSSSAPSAPIVPVPSDPPPRPKQPTLDSLQVGKHTQDSHFVSMSSVGAEESFPRAVMIAGCVPGLTADSFLKTPAALYSKKPAAGNLFLTRLPEGFSGDFISIPCTNALQACGDPVVVLIEAEDFASTKLPVAPEDNVVLLVDRADCIEDVEDFDDRAFYAWDIDGYVSVGWMSELPPREQATCLGRVVYGIIEVDLDLRKSKSCWEEENETYM